MGVRQRIALRHRSHYGRLLAQVRRGTLGVLLVSKAGVRAALRTTSGS